MAVRLSRDPLIEAWRCVCKAIETRPDNVDALVLAGELWLHDWREMGFGDHSETDAAAVALTYFDAALSNEDAHANAWAGKTCSLKRLQRYEEALEAGQRGITALSQRVGDGMDRALVYRLVAEELYDGTVDALLHMGRGEEAWDVLREALSEFPDSDYLLRLVPPVEVAVPPNRRPAGGRILDREVGEEASEYDVRTVVRLLQHGRARRARQALDDALARFPDSQRLLALITRVDAAMARRGFGGSHDGLAC